MSNDPRIARIMSDHITDEEATDLVALFYTRAATSDGAKTTAAVRAYIRWRYAQGGITQQELADAFGVHQTTISHIIHRQTGSTDQ